MFLQFSFFTNNKNRFFLFVKSLKRTIYVRVTTFSCFFRSILYKICNSSDKKACIPLASVYSSDPKCVIPLPIWRCLRIPPFVSPVHCMLYSGREHRKVGWEWCDLYPPHDEMFTVVSASFPSPSKFIYVIYLKTAIVLLACGLCGPCTRVGLLRLTL